MNRTLTLLIGTALGFQLNTLFLLLLLWKWMDFHRTYGGDYDSLVHHHSVRWGGFEWWPEGAGLVGLLFPLVGYVYGRICPLSPKKVLSDTGNQKLILFLQVFTAFQFCVCTLLYLGFNGV